MRVAFKHVTEQNGPDAFKGLWQGPAFYLQIILREMNSEVYIPPDIITRELNLNFNNPFHMMIGWTVITNLHRVSRAGDNIVLAWGQSPGRVDIS